ncbi:kelch-like protein diablo [Haemaphysalis longicornis]
MKAPGDGIDAQSGSEDNCKAATSARQLFGDVGRQRHFAPGVVARSMPMLRAMRRDHEHCDVTLRTIEGTEFWAHRFVLAARYAGCDAFFSDCDERPGLVGESMPAQQGTVWPPIRDVEVSGISSEMLEILIDLAYQIPIHERVGLHNVREVLDVAEALNIAKVRDYCLQLLGKNLEPENCIGTYQLALSKGYMRLTNDAFLYIIRNFDKVWTSSSQFQSLRPDELRSVLYNDELHARNEVECAFGAILKWIAGNAEDRR